MQYFTVNLPCKKYVVKYIAANYGAPAIATLDTDFGHTVISSFTSRLKTKHRQPDINCMFRRLNAQLRIFLPMDYLYQVRELDQHAIVLLNRHFETKFEEDLFHVVQRASWLGIPRTFAIESFATNHGIEVDEDISMDAMKKMEYRFRVAAKAQKKFTPVLSPSVELFFSIGERRIIVGEFPAADKD